MLDRTDRGIVSSHSRRRRRSAAEKGQTLPEYALILATVAVAVTVAIVFLKGSLDDLFTAIVQVF